MATGNPQDAATAAAFDEIARLIADGQHEAASAAHKQLLDGSKASSLDALLQARANAAPVTAPVPKAPAGAKPGAATLPKGISGKHVAAFVAAAAVIGGGIYLATRKKPEREESWTERVQAERQAASQGRSV